MVGWRMDYIVYGLLTSSGTRYYNEKSVRWIKLWSNYFFFFFSSRKWQIGMIWTISVSLPSSLCTLIIYEEIAKVPKVFVVCSYLCITHSHLYLLTFFKPFLLPSVPFFVVDSPVAYYPAPKIQTLWIDVIV